MPIKKKKTMQYTTCTIKGIMKYLLSTTFHLPYSKKAVKPRQLLGSLGEEGMVPTGP